MQKQKTSLTELTLVGLAMRTNNQDEMNPQTAKIGNKIAEYFEDQANHGIQHRSKPGVTYCAYTEFESDEHGEYTYFIGEAVDSLDGQDLENYKAITIPAGSYQKFTTEPGQMPNIVISAWQEIWQMNTDDFEGVRRYHTDFEIYDERAANPNEAAVDIFIGLE